MRFFQPTEEFLDWLAARAAGRMVIDVGCGECHIVRALAKRNVKVFGIDPNFTHTIGNLDLASCVIPLEAQDFFERNQPENALVLFCRPSHSGWVAQVIDLLPVDAEMLYISRPENVETDIISEGFRAEPVLDAPECLEEKVYLVPVTAREDIHQPSYHPGDFVIVPV